MNNQIMGNLLNFFAVAVVFLVILLIFFGLYAKKFKITERNASIYGLFLDLDTRSLIAIASLTINYLFLVWCTVSFQKLNVIYVAIMLLLVIVSDAIIDNFKGLWVSFALTGVNCAVIHVVYLIYQYLCDNGFSFPLLLILFLLILFVFLYYTYNLLRGINNVVIKNKYLKKKKYSV